MLKNLSAIFKIESIPLNIDAHRINTHFTLNDLQETVSHIRSSESAYAFVPVQAHN